MTETLKEISYRGGIVKFNIPENWYEEYDPDGGGIFFEDAPDSGTLRLNIITLQDQSDNDSGVLIDFIKSMPNVELISNETLDNGNKLARSLKKSQQKGTKITMYYWNLLNHVPPDHLRIANYSYTILTSKENDESTINEIKLLDNQIRKSEFHPTLGE